MNAAKPDLRLSRRAAISALFAFAAFLPACVRGEDDLGAGRRLDGPSDPGEVGTKISYEDNVDALLEVLLPADRDADGHVTTPGARELEAGRLFGDGEFIALATGLGFLAAQKADVIDAATASEGGLRLAINAALDVRAARVRPLTHFSDLTPGEMLAVVDDAYADDAVKPLLDVARVAAFVAYLGALYADDGLVAIGFPPYEDFEGGVAVSGYPRTKEGRLVDASTEDLGALAASGELDDYTYNALPADSAAPSGLLASGDLP